jgi:hypothetical protein
VLNPNTRVLDYFDNETTTKVNGSVSMDGAQIVKSNRESGGGGKYVSF